MHKIPIKQVANSLNITLDNEDYIKGVSTDTRTLNNGDLYIAIKGENFDGHDFLDEAYKKGAIATVTSRKFDGKNNLLVEDTILALGCIAKSYKLMFDIFTVCVTGSVGKTSTKEIISSVLSKKSKTIKTIGNKNNEIGLPLTLFNINNEYDNGVFELGMSNLGEISYLSKICEPDVGVITNIGVSHIENLKTKENILKAKLEIADGMNYDSPLVLNGDDKMLWDVELKDERPVIYYGIENKMSEVLGFNIKYADNKTTFTIKAYGKEYEVSMNTIGKYHVYNALAAFCIGVICDMNPIDIIDGISNFETIDMRQSIQLINGVTVIADCYNSSPDSMLCAIDTIANINCSGKRIGVFGDILELGEISNSEHFEIGRNIANSNIDLLICYGDKSREIKNGACSFGMRESYFFPDEKEISKFILSNINQGDTIIYKASRGIKLENIMNTVNERLRNE